MEAEESAACMAAVVAAINEMAPYINVGWVPIVGLELPRQL